MPNEQKSSTIELSDEDKAFIIETAILFDCIGGVPVNWALVREIDRRLLALKKYMGVIGEVLKTDECIAARAKGTLR
jgi:hypothetical protein